MLRQNPHGRSMCVFSHNCQRISTCFLFIWIVQRKAQISTLIFICVLQEMYNKTTTNMKEKSYHSFWPFKWKRIINGKNFEEEKKKIYFWLQCCFCFVFFFFLLLLHVSSHCQFLTREFFSFFFSIFRYVVNNVHTHR